MEASSWARDLLEQLISSLPLGPSMKRTASQGTSQTGESAAKRPRHPTEQFEWNINFEPDELVPSQMDSPAAPPDVDDDKRALLEHVRQLQGERDFWRKCSEDGQKSLEASKARFSSKVVGLTNVSLTLAEMLWSMTKDFRAIDAMDEDDMTPIFDLVIRRATSFTQKMCHPTHGHHDPEDLQLSIALVGCLSNIMSSRRMRKALKACNLSGRAVGCIADLLVSQGLASLPTVVSNHLKSVCLTFLCNVAMSACLVQDIQKQQEPLAAMRSMDWAPGHQTLLEKLETRMSRATKPNHQPMVENNQAMLHQTLMPQKSLDQSEEFGQRSLPPEKQMFDVSEIQKPESSLFGRHHYTESERNLEFEELMRRGPEEGTWDEGHTRQAKNNSMFEELMREIRP